MFAFLYFITLLPVFLYSLVSCCGDKDSEKSSAQKPVQGAPKRAAAAPVAKKPKVQKSGCQTPSSEHANLKDPSDFSKVSAVQSAPTPTKEGAESKDKKESKQSIKDSKLEEKPEEKKSKKDSKEGVKKEEPKKVEEAPVEPTQLDTLVEKKPIDKIVEDEVSAKDTAEDMDGKGPSNKNVRSKRSMETMAAIWDHDFI